MAVSMNLRIDGRRKGRNGIPGQATGAGFAVTLKIQSENSAVREPLARGRVEGLKAARIGLTSCPECCGHRIDIQQSVLN